jgi:hypothetical protein
VFICPELSRLVIRVSNCRRLAGGLRPGPDLSFAFPGGTTDPAPGAGAGRYSQPRSPNAERSTPGGAYHPVET